MTLLQNQRALERTQRELDRERQKLERQEKTIVSEIKKSAKNGQISAARIQAKDLVRTKNYIQKFNNMRTQLQAISLRIQAVRSSDQMANSMKDAARLLNGMNRSMNMPQLTRIVMEFEKQNDIMDQRQEMMDDAIDNAMGDDIEEDEEEVDEIVNQVLDEIGVDLNSSLQNAPETIAQKSNPLSNNPVPQAIGGGIGDEDDLQARLDILKRQ
ncbi:uncharacterized protein ASCRUDRAFT_77193 [Ascoidea rubescens DSM 1968]|uniref:Snf7-domain-containing protein n=1 Tax=Ascoidea rubescens DSM 1968 TaxID=1344418 RepID=A0A1D2VCT5_9ASCO|nr:hypothetical protein ASCRUDRAFT_77181 [Ascoidea rubescens DSM 1968]XP_020045770.1 hypothetical protein ASCRUDRAFT_77193 [Ascoidea rubescens DSM 1968]ODV59446.1 hypothetical protein ASCRUDRAFT_77181 [Ascoidea rubescens DSM 1968]ODV59463.1 hypothetical protein ASCRUDRAFT_77193 [Ascoidea rubescens DSM 1968]